MLLVTRVKAAATKHRAVCTQSLGPGSGAGVGARAQGTEGQGPGPSVSVLRIWLIWR